MSGNYLPLYRKYRPQTLDKLVGQEHIKKTLTSAIELGKVAHAFLFTGPRGTGKTSTARILARSLNCKNGPTVHPCGECESCRDILNSIPIDVIEIDAASNRKVEDTQNILEKIQYVPVHGRYKIYIIDEVHMLTNHAFNALLKTLEEPPENVIFILATTEVHKVLDTIKSRCQRFDFRRITTSDIVKHLRYISDEEKINITDDALYTIAKNSAGGMRDSISLLDQLSLLGATSQITSDDVNSILGRISFDALHKLSSKIISSSPEEAIAVISEIYNAGNEPLRILTNLSEYFKNLLIVKNCSPELLSELTGLNSAQTDLLSEQKDLLETSQIVFLIERISHYIKEIKQASNQYLWLEVGMIDLSDMAENTSLINLERRISALENGVSAPIPVRNTETVIKPVQKEPVKQNQEKSEDGASEEQFTPPPISKKSDGTDIQTLWKSLLSNIKSPSTRALLNLATPIKIAEDGIVLTFKNEKLVSQISDNNKKQLISEAGGVMFNQPSVPVLIKLYQPSANSTPKQEVKPSSEIEKKKIDPVKETSSNQTYEEEIDDNSDEDVIEDIGAEDAVKEDNISSVRLETDQEKMVLELFDGKFVE